MISSASRATAEKKAKKVQECDERRRAGVQSGPQALGEVRFWQQQRWRAEKGLARRPISEMTPPPDRDDPWDPWGRVEAAVGFNEPRDASPSPVPAQGPGLNEQGVSVVESDPVAAVAALRAAADTLEQGMQRMQERVVQEAVAAEDLARATATAAAAASSSLRNADAVMADEERQVHEEWSQRHSRSRRGRSESRQRAISRARGGD